MLAKSTREGMERKPLTFSNGRKATIQESLNRLERLSAAIRLLGIGIFSCALIAFMLLVGSFVSLYYRGADNAPSGFGLLVSTQMSSTVGLILLFVWDRTKKRGAMYSEVISDELEWRHRRLSPSDRAAASVVAALDQDRKPRKLTVMAVRLQLRDFLNATDLPFASPGMSTSAYAVWFLFCVFTAIYLVPYLSRHGFVQIAAL